MMQKKSIIGEEELEKSDEFHSTQFKLITVNTANHHSNEEKYVFQEEI